MEGAPSITYRVTCDAEGNVYLDYLTMDDTPPTSATCDTPFDSAFLPAGYCLSLGSPEVLGTKFLCTKDNTAEYYIYTSDRKYYNLTQVTQLVILVPIGAAIAVFSELVTGRCHQQGRHRPEYASRFPFICELPFSSHIWRGEGCSDAYSNSI